ncbi:MAG: sporulation integral membrane protein YtvI [Ruminococcaceae bacterium]|nr:sporulation integral membrane protein YtvI [Oscillospiraceae bacterium]
MTDVEKRRKTIINIVYYAMVIGLCFLFARYAMGVCFPIVCAFFLATILQRPKNFLTKKTFLKSGSASVLSLFTLIFVFLFLIALIGVRAVQEIKGFIDYITMQLQNIDVFVTNIENAVLGFIDRLPDFISGTLTESVTTIFVQIREYIAGQSTELADSITGTLGNSFSVSWITTPLSGVISTAKQIPSILIAVVITLVATCFMTSDYDSIIGFIKRQFPENKRGDLSRAKALLKSTLSKMGKAYILIMSVTFIEMFIGLSVLRVFGIYSSNYTVIIAIVTAIVDIIPVLGTGTVLIPWAAYNLIVGNYSLAIGLAVIYAAITVIRQIIEPKLVAGQLGLSPVVTICSLYLGLKIFGVFGMIIAPILVTMLKVLNDEGIIKLWKSEKHENDEIKEKNKKKDSTEESAADKKEKALPKADETK